MLKENKKLLKLSIENQKERAEEEDVGNITKNSISLGIVLAFWLFFKQILLLVSFCGEILLRRLSQNNKSQCL